VTRKKGKVPALSDGEKLDKVLAYLDSLHALIDTLTKRLDAIKKLTEEPVQ
jgi:hypothetical protein